MSLLIGLDDVSPYNTSSQYIIPGGVNKKLNYYSLNHLYYSSFSRTEGSILQSSSYDNYLESSFTSASRYLSNSGIVYSIPRNLFGTHIEPGSVLFSSGSHNITDDGEGNLISGSNNVHVGNVIYSHGQIIITNNVLYSEFKTDTGQAIAWKANLPIYTLNYSVKISDYEYNFTYNPTAQSGSYIEEYSGSRFVRTTGILADNVTGSAFQPYITTVGLYNDSNELIAVGKMAQPVPIPANTELTVNIKLDI